MGMKTTIDLPEGLLKEVRTAVRRRGWTVRALFEESLRAFPERENAAGEAAPFELRHTVVEGEAELSMTFAEMLEVSGINRIPQ
jgi:hypothetical protein